MLAPRFRVFSSLFLCLAIAACSSGDDAAPASSSPEAKSGGNTDGEKEVANPQEPTGSGGGESSPPSAGKGGSSTGKGGTGGSGGGAGSSSSGKGGGAGGPSQGSAGASNGAGVPEAPPPPPPAQLPPEEMAIPTCESLDKSKAATFYLSADDSNSMASPVMARHLLEQGSQPPPGYIRTYEFLNYYNVAFEAPGEGSLRIVPQLRDGETPGSVSLQIGVQSAPSPAVRRPITMTFVLDNSGSMMGAPLKNQRESVLAIAKKLQAGDIVSIVTWNTANRVVLSGHAITGADDATLLAAIAKIDASGGTDINGGLVAGYELAQKHFGANRINRVVVISDGIANAGVTEKEIIGKQADDNNKEGIYLVGIAVGEGFNDTLLNVVTDAGNGAYLYVDSPGEATRMLTERFDETFAVAARDVRVRADFPWYFQIKQFFGEEFSTDPAKVKPQHLAPGDAMVFQQTLQACAAGEIKDEDSFTFSATWGDPISYEEKTVTVATTLGALRQGAKLELGKGEAIVAYAEALKKPAGEKRTAAIAKAKEQVLLADPEGKDAALVEIRGLLDLVK